MIRQTSGPANKGVTLDNGDLLLNAALAAESGPEVDRISESVIAIGENHPNPQEAIRAYLTSRGDEPQ